MGNETAYRRIQDLQRPLGLEQRDLVLGLGAIRLTGLDESIARSLTLRWGRFLRAVRPERQPVARVFVLDAGEAGWIEHWQPGEEYRIEPLGDVDQRVVASYHFAMAAGTAAGDWRLAVNRVPDEPLERVLDNALRVLCAHLAVDRGGFSMHAAGVLYEGRAYLFAGPSGSGKTTAVGLSAPAQSLGDDFALVIPGEQGWVASALPFDNLERVPDGAPRGLFPLAAILRLYKAEDCQVTLPRRSLADASLMSTVAFPWIMPERAAQLLEHVGDCVQADLFRHLHFARDSALWTVLV